MIVARARLRSSGRRGSDPETSWHMSKTGNARLRAAAYGFPTILTLSVLPNPLTTFATITAGTMGMGSVDRCPRADPPWRTSYVLDPGSSARTASSTSR